MLTLQLPTLLALLGTALMAVVIFAPAPVAAKVTVSPAPPAAPLSFERWDVPRAERAPAWPALVDARAASCDAASRLALVDALVTVRRAWAGAILRRALDDEPDALVRDAIVAALRAGGAR